MIDEEAREEIMFEKRTEGQILFLTALYVRRKTEFNQIIKTLHKLAYHIINRITVSKCFQQLSFNIKHIIVVEIALSAKN